jgi:hypothetical protein
MAATATFAQNTLVATLSHGESISMYYGAYALRNAMNTAVSGDVINLSGGAFQAVNITKGVIMRGTGIDDAAPTYINGDFTINVAAEDANRLSMEGIRCNGTISMKGSFNSPYFVKCAFSKFDYNSDNTIKNVLFVNCRITDSYYLRGASSVQFINSYVSGFNNLSETTSAASFINCVIYPWDGNCPEYIRSSQLVNCIIYSSGYSLPSTSMASNCVSIRNTHLFDDLVTKQNCSFSTYQEMFKSFTGKYSDNETFELTDAAKAKYLGTDGTEVGMHGGVLPYDTTPSYPQITKMNVANKTTADGKLSVEIEVSATE